VTTLQVLKNARAQIMKGWCKEYVRKSTGECCILGALVYANEVPGRKVYRAAANRRQVFREAVRALCEVIPEFQKLYQILTHQSLCSALDYQKLYQVNDNPETTQEDVLHLFDAAIKKLEVK